MRRFLSLLATHYSFLVLLAIALRLALIPNPGFEADISFWKSWGLATVDKGIVEGMKVTNNNYPTPFAYTLGSMVAIYSLFADPHNFNEFWNNSNILFLTISKLYPVFADIGIALLIVYIGKHAKKLGFPDISHSFFGLPFYSLLSVLYLLNPISLIDGAWWGQVDSLGVFLFLFSVLCVLSRRPFLAGLLFMVAMMTKLQNMIYGPVYFLFIWQYTGYTGLIRAITGAVIAFFGLNIEFVLSKNMDRVIASLTENYDYFPWMSLNAFNLWWIVTGAKGMVTSDKLTMIGIVNAKTIGLLLFSSLYLFAVLRQLALVIPDLIRDPSSSSNTGFRLGGRNDIKIQTFLESLIIVNAAFFLFQTQSHDRYAFPLSVFLLLWGVFYISEQIHNHKDMATWSHGQMAKKLKSDLAIQPSNHFTIFFLFYALFTLVYFYNLHYALAINYPRNAIPILSALTHPALTISTSAILIALFFVFLTKIVRSSQFSVYCFLFSLLIAISGLLYLNTPLFTRTPVLLTTFTPFTSEQAYGSRQTDKSVQSSFGGPNGWNRLSVQYAFYRHGIGTHANSRHVYNVNGLFRTFKTDYGIDTESGTKASAVFEIYGDGTLLFRSEKMGRFDHPRHISVDITGVQNLTLITTDAKDGNYDDHTDWLNPILWP